LCCECGARPPTTASAETKKGTSLFLDISTGCAEVAWWFWTAGFLGGRFLRALCLSPRTSTAARGQACSPDFRWPALILFSPRSFCHHRLVLRLPDTKGSLANPSGALAITSSAGAPEHLLGVSFQASSSASAALWPPCDWVSIDGGRRLLFIDNDLACDATVLTGRRESCDLFRTGNDAKGRRIRQCQPRVRHSRRNDNSSSPRLPGNSAPSAGTEKFLDTRHI